MARPRQYDQIRYFVGQHRFINHSMLETKFNLRYRESRKAIQMLQDEKIIGCEHDIANKGYEVLVKTYKAEMV